MNSGEAILLGRFPPNVKNEPSDKRNPAIRLYGRRFYKDQTPVEYLAEFLLVFASPKGVKKDGDYRFSLELDDGQPCYWPENRIALKLLAFFPSSKLETRHPVHQKEYQKAIEDIKGCIAGSPEEKNEAVRLLQSLFMGFVGVAKNRTWVTHSFLPVSPSLLGREVGWKHAKALKDVVLKDLSTANWDNTIKYFEVGQHNFMARGGEHLFLQLSHLFSSPSHLIIDEICSLQNYRHLKQSKLPELKENIEKELKSILSDAIGPIDVLANFVEKALSSYQVDISDKEASLGWVPTASLPEAFLFAVELDNICKSTLGALEKSDLLQMLSSMHVLRSLCFQARRMDDSQNFTEGFIGRYSWIVADSNSQIGSAVRKLAQSSFDRIEAMLYRVLRLIPKLPDEPAPDAKALVQADKHGFEIFRKIAKELGLVIPRNGGEQRFVLPPQLLRFLVAALISPGERIRLTEFYERVFAHYGIALGNQQLIVSLNLSESNSSKKNYSATADTAWVEEALHQGGFLVELSDAVSIVLNPSSRDLEA